MRKKTERCKTWIRLGKGYTQKQVADAIGVSQPTVGAALRGDNSTRLTIASREIAMKEYGGVEYNIQPINI